MSYCIDDLRNVLFETIHSLKAGKTDPITAQKINSLAETLVETAKVEVAFLKVTGEVKSAFFEKKKALPTRPEAGALPAPRDPASAAANESSQQGHLVEAGPASLDQWPPRPKSHEYGADGTYTHKI